MMGKSVIAYAVLLLLVLIAPAFAAPAVWIDSIDQAGSPVNLGGSGQNYYQFDLDITNDGFAPGLDEVDSYALTIELSDDGDFGWELAYINLPGFLSDRIIEVDNENYGFDMSVQGLASLNETGILSVGLYAISGDFYFIGSQLEASGNSNSVPLPASLLLLGTGLLGLTRIRRRR